MIKVGNKFVQWKNGITIKDILEKIDDSHFYPVVRINGKHISKHKFANTCIPDNSEVFLIQMVAGG